MDLPTSLPEGWTVWNAERGGRVVLTYRPDVFDGSDFPPACLPTLTVAPGAAPDRRPQPRGRPDGWHVALYLEPDVRIRAVDTSVDDRSRAIEQALTVAQAFTSGEIDYRAAYQEPREAYLDQLDTFIHAD